MFEKLIQQNIRIIQDFITPGESTLRPGESSLGPGESTFFSGESTLRSGETSSGEWAIGRNDRQSESNFVRVNQISSFEIKWSILTSAAAYSNKSKRYNLCLAEKFFIIKAEKSTLLNKRSELVSKCRHENKFYLMNLKADHT